MPDERYFSMPSAEVGGDVRRNRALNCWPCVRSLVHSPEAVIHSPPEMMAAWPTTVTKSRWPRAFARRTQKPFSGLVWANWLASGWCLKEYGLARGLNKKLLAALIDPAKSVSDLSLELT